LDIVAAGVGGQAGGWNVHPGHFAERHGLFVIIALGETLIVAASGVSDAVWTNQLFAAGVLVVLITGGLWWSYFHRAMPALEHALASSQGSKRTKIARDSYSMIHFLMLVGVIAYAAAIEEAITHPAAPLPQGVGVAFALGMIFFVGGMAAALWKADGTLPLPRIILIALTGLAILAAMGWNTLFTLGIALIGVLSIGVIEQRAQSRVGS